ncbi:MAG: hypothetical protein RIS09_1062 [Actinomycetota bacterium]
MSFVDKYVSMISDVIVNAGTPVSQVAIDEVIEKLRLSPSPSEYNEISLRVKADLSGYGPLEPYIDSTTTDIFVNSPTDIWIMDLEGMRKLPITLHTEQAVRRLASRLALAGRQRLDEALPYVDALLPDGARLHAIIPPLALHHTSISLRFPSEKIIEVSRWVDDSGLSGAARTLLDQVCAAQMSAIICGTTGAGKTALLRSILGRRPVTHRSIVIEDVAELNITRNNTVQLQARTANSEGIGYVSMQTLVRQSLRMKPDSIVVGEIRGNEVIDFLLAISSGHVGSISTIHAHDFKSLENRIGLLSQVAGFDREFARLLFRQSIDVVLQVEHRQGKRAITRVERISE